MKYRYLILLALIAYGCGTKKQALIYDKTVVTQHTTPVAFSQEVNKYRPFADFKGDTLAYLKANFISRKKLYLDRPLNNLLRDMEPVFKYFSPGVDNRTFTTSPYLYLKFFNAYEQENRLNNRKASILLVYWKQALPGNRMNALIKESKGIWNKEAQDYFSDKVVYDIKIVE